MGRRGTTKPCPGCGGNKRREVNEVCSSCKSLMRDGTIFRQIEREYRESPRYLAIEIPDTWCKPTYYSVPHWSSNENEVGELLKKLAHHLAEYPIQTHRWWDSCGREHETRSCDGKKLVLFQKKQRCARWESYRRAYMRKDLAVILHKLNLAIEKALCEIGCRGEAYGKNVLVQLARGEITFKELTKNCMED